MVSKKMKLIERKQKAGITLTKEEMEMLYISYYGNGYVVIDPLTGEEHIESNKNKGGNK